MTTSSNPYGNINFGTNSTLNNFIETPTNEMLINNNQRLTPGMRNAFMNGSQGGSGSLSFKKK